jgi:hypothetical protein
MRINTSTSTSTSTGSRVSCLFLYFQYLIYLIIRISTPIHGFEIFHEQRRIRIGHYRHDYYHDVRHRWTIRTSITALKRRTTSNGDDTIVSMNANTGTGSNNNNINIPQYSSDLLPNPNPTFQAIDVVTACMNTLVENRHDTHIGLDVCFAFSNDRCRAAIGGNIQEFYQYATNPTFVYLTSCVSYHIVSMGPIIHGTTHRGAMQTILLDVIPSITTSMTLPSSSTTTTTATTTSSTTTTTTVSTATTTKSSLSSSSQSPPPIPPRRFLWTLQQERRPPLQNCWMIHEVLYTKNAFQQTM